MKKRILLTLVLGILAALLLSCGSPKNEESLTETETEETKPEVKTVTEAADILKIPNGAKAIVTISHDDGTLATVEFLDEQFRQNNLRGTVCLIVKNFVSDTGTVYAETVKKWTPYFESGLFDVACHSWTHSFMGKTDEGDVGLVLYSNTDKSKITNNNATIPAGNLSKEIIKSREALMECFPGQRVLAFVKAGTPGYKDASGKFIQISPDAMELIKENYIVMRNTTDGLKDAALVENAPVKDIYNLHSLQVSPKQTGEQWKQYVDWAIAKNGWMTYLFHQIVEDSKASGINVGKTASAELFEYVGEKVASGEVWCAFLTDAAQYTEEFRSAKGTVETAPDDIRVTVTDELDDELYCYPLTVKVKVPAEWTSVTLAHADGTTEALTPFADGEQTFVYANVVPDSGTATLKKAD